MKKLSILLIIMVVFGFGALAEAKRGSAVGVDYEEGEETYTLTEGGGLLVQWPVKSQFTGDLEGTMESVCTYFYPFLAPAEDYYFYTGSWSCLGVFIGTLKGEPVKAIMNSWQADVEGEVRKFEIMQGSGGLQGKGTYTGPSGGERYFEFNYWFCENENEQACNSRMGY
jgi:hypothetical protein